MASDTHVPCQAVPYGQYLGSSITAHANTQVFPAGIQGQSSQGIGPRCELFRRH